MRDVPSPPKMLQPPATESPPSLLCALSHAKVRHTRATAETSAKLRQQANPSRSLNNSGESTAEHLSETSEIRILPRPMPARCSMECLNRAMPPKPSPQPFGVWSRRGNYDKEIGKLKQQLAQEFEVEDLGLLRYFLGIEVSQRAKGIYLSQRKYIMDLLSETGIAGYRPASTPIEANQRLTKGGSPIDREQYQRLLGRLIYSSHTHPDVSFAVSVVSRFMHEPKSHHMDAVMRIIRYLKGCPGRGLLYTPHGNLQVECYTDADWAGSVNDRRSTSGYCAFVGGNLVTWRSKKHNVVVRSTAEAEFRSMAHGICEVLRLKILLMDLGYFNSSHCCCTVIIKLLLILLTTQCNTVRQSI